MVGIEGRKVDLQRLAFARGPGADRRQNRGGIGVAHRDADGLRIGTHRAQAVVAVVGHPHADVIVLAQVASHRRPLDQRPAVADLRRDGQAGRQLATHGLDGECQRVLVRVACLHQERQLVAHQRDLVADVCEPRRLGRRLRLQDEAAGVGHRWRLNDAQIVDQQQ